MGWGEKWDKMGGNGEIMSCMRYYKIGKTDESCQNISLRMQLFPQFFLGIFIYIAMLLFYETSSLRWDDTDLIHGKFIPAKPNVFHYNCYKTDCLQYKQNLDSVRFFINIYGTFANLTGRFAERYDNLEIPTKIECVFDPDYVYTHIPKSGVEAIMEEDEFWKHVEPYPWYMLLMGEVYKLCDGDFTLMLPIFNGLQMEDRLTWVWRHFGVNVKKRTAMLERDVALMLIRGRNDVFIGSNLYMCEKWSEAGGSAFWWPELDGKCKEPAKILMKRIRLLSQAVSDLRELSK